MSFDSLEFLLFLPLTVLLHWLCPSRWRWVVLLGASYLFYAWWDLRLSGLILAVTAVSWLAGLGLERTVRPGLRRLWLGATLTVSLGLLGYFKYFNFLGRTAAALGGLLGGGGTWEAWDIVLPVGVSFYTFQALSYVVDVYRGNLAAEGHFGYYALYISFFPQLVAGPIERAGTLLPQLRGERTLSREDLGAGCRLLLSGFFRKLAVADLCAPFVERVFSAPNPDGSAVAAGAVLFALQIYCDFAGYSEIAAGSARLLGVKLMRNFDRPYLAVGVRDFWRRWHISLTGWFTDYVYIPLGGSRRGLPRQIFATFVVFALSGLWHGAAWTFVLWGLLHGGYLAGELLLRNVFGTGEVVGVKKWVLRALTFALVSFAWLFFRAESVGQALALAGALFSPWHLEAGAACLGMGMADLSALALTVFCLPALNRLTGEKGRETPDMTYVFLTLAAGLAWLIRLETGGDSAFIYFQF